MRRALVLVVLFACGSKGSGSDAPPAVRSGAEADKLWALAPPGTDRGLVITPHGIDELARAFVRVRGQIATYPEFALAKPMLDQLAQIGLDKDHSLADIGLSTELGFAMFGTARDALIILPVADRARFVRATHGMPTGDADIVKGVTCQPTPHGYACAMHHELVEQIGKGSLVGKLDAGARGDAELWMAAGAFDKAVDGLSIAAVLDDGVVDVHAVVKTPAFAKLDVQAMPPDPKGGGFLVGNLLPIFELTEGSSENVAQFKGPVAATMSTSALAFLARAPLADAAKMQRMIDHCDVIGKFANLPSTTKDGVCHINFPAVVQMGIDAWIEDGELRVAQAKGAFDPGTGSSRTPIGDELAGYPFAVWGRGTVFAMDLAKRLPPDAAANLPDLSTVLRAFAQVTEVGAGAKFSADGVHAHAYLRTIWANPREVAEGVGNISAADLLSGKGDELAAKLAGDSPFGRDLRAGPGGLMMPTTILGILAAVAVPAFLDYRKHAKQTEANLKLRQLAANAKTYYIANGKFPAGQAGLTPVRACCGSPQNKCPPADWSADVWKALDFQIETPTLFQYSYASDGDSFNATAVGDLDCDGIAITYNLSGVSENGKPRTTLSEPPPNSD